MAAKKKGGFRFRKTVLDELKAMAEGRPHRPVCCTGSRRAVKRIRAGGMACASPPPQP